MNSNQGNLYKDLKEDTDSAQQIFSSGFFQRLKLSIDGLLSNDNCRGVNNFIL